MAAAWEYSVKQHNYQSSFNADGVNTDDQLNALAGQGWEIVTAEVGNFPYVTILWKRALTPGDAHKDESAD